MQNYKKMKKGMENNIEVFFNLYDKNKGYCQSLGRNVMESLKKYLVEVVGLKEIYERKDKLTNKYLNNWNNFDLYKFNSKLPYFLYLLENVIILTRNKFSYQLT